MLFLFFNIKPIGDKIYLVSKVWSHWFFQEDAERPLLLIEGKTKPHTCLVKSCDLQSCPQEKGSCPR